MTRSCAVLLRVARGRPGSYTVKEADGRASPTGPGASTPDRMDTGEGGRPERRAADAAPPCTPRAGRFRGEPVCKFAPRRAPRRAQSVPAPTLRPATLLPSSG